MLGLFKIIRNKKVFIELQFLQSIKIHNIFYQNLLQKMSIDPLTYWINKLLFLIIINNEEKWKVEDILDARCYGNKLQY